MTAVVLAAGIASRMGVQKLLLPVRGRRMIDCVLDACANLPTVVVASPDLAKELGGNAAHVVVNSRPELGMAYSLVLAHAEISADRAILVFLGDKPLVTASLAQTIIDTALRSGADVCFPVRDGVGGHPVYFSARARSGIPECRGDSLQALRDDPRLSRVAVEVAEEGAYFDVDDPGALLRVHE